MKVFFDFGSAQIVPTLGIRLDPGVNEVSDEQGEALLAIAGLPVRRANPDEAEGHAQAAAAREAVQVEERQRERALEIEAEGVQPTEPVIAPPAAFRRRGQPRE